MDGESIQINGYTIDRVLGHGGMATVYLAIQESFERNVAIKVMAEQLSSDPSFGERFLREAKIVSRLIHPNIVTVYDVGVVNNHHYLSMEYIEGEDLKHRLKTISLYHIIKVIKEIALALDFAGRKGYVHRDIKPENVMINNEDGRAVLMDFGIAKAFDSVSEMTQTGTAIGTPYYMSPEQAKGKDIDWRSDIYSLGVVFYQLLTGKLPYDGDSAVSVGIKHLTDPIPNIPDYLHATFQPIIDKLMAKNPEDRFQNGSDFIAALNTIPEHQLASLDQQFSQLGNRETSEHTFNTANTPIISHTTGRKHVIPDDATQIISHTPRPTNQSNSASVSRNKGLVFGAIIGITLLSVGGGYFWQTSSQPPVDNPEQQPNVSAPSQSNAQTGQPAESSIVTNSPVDTDTAKNNQVDDSTVKQDQALSVNSNESNLTTPPEISPQQLIREEEQAKTLKKIEALLVEANALEQQISDNPELVDELHQTYRLISLLDDQHESLNKGAIVIQKVYMDSLNQSIQNERYEDATKTMSKLLRKYPNLANSDQIEEFNEEINTGIEIDKILIQANKRFVSDKLMSPAQDNAYYFYRQILSLKPTNTAARTGLENISKRYNVLAQSQLTNKQYDTAITYVDNSLKVTPRNNDQAIALKKKIQQEINNNQQAKQQQRLFEQQFNEAKFQFDNNNLFPPSDNNAYQLFQAILAKSPEHLETQQYMTQLEIASVTEFPMLLNTEKFELAQDVINKAKLYFPTSEKISQLQQNLTLAINNSIAASQPKVVAVEVKGQSFSSVNNNITSNDNVKADRTIYIGFTFANFGDSTSVMQALLFDGARTVKMSTVPVILTSDSGEKFFKISRPVNGFSEGGYFLDLILNNEKLTTVQFSIEN